ncbi:MAG: hypothetical protein FWF23_00160 [Alphaproteobacteria bacterium]|nr:hypothetical protein [Alphaproteobacteria bacterium]MCL2504836.1 hypothetical protein [Alphaproteobacteria bacterium]
MNTEAKAAKPEINAVPTWGDNFKELKNYIKNEWRIVVFFMFVMGAVPLLPGMNTGFLEFVAVNMQEMTEGAKEAELMQVPPDMAYKIIMRKIVDTVLVCLGVWTFSAIYMKKYLRKKEIELSAKNFLSWFWNMFLKYGALMIISIITMMLLTLIPHIMYSQEEITALTEAMAAGEQAASLGLSVLFTLGMLVSTWIMGWVYFKWILVTPLVIEGSKKCFKESTGLTKGKLWKIAYQYSFVFSVFFLIALFAQVFPLPYSSLGDAGTLSGEVSRGFRGFLIGAADVLMYLGLSIYTCLLYYRLNVKSGNNSTFRTKNYPLLSQKTPAGGYKPDTP